MAPSIWLSVFYTVILYIPLIAAQQFAYRYHICTNDSTYTTNSSFPLNLNASLSSLYENASRSDDFSSISVGHNSDRVYALFLCRGDNSPELCQGCIKTTSEDIMIRCPNYKEAIIWYDRCMLRYSNRSIFSVTEERPKAWLWNVNVLYRLALNYSFFPFPVVGDEITSVQSLQFQLGTIEAATNNFAEENKIGKGGFGDVYRGTLPNGQHIAVKRLSKHSGQGAAEFKNEVELVAKL